MEKETFISKIKTRVGYVEAKDKEAYISACLLAKAVLEEHYEPILKSKEQTIKNEKEMKDLYLKDLKTLSEIINNY